MATAKFGNDEIIKSALDPYNNKVREFRCDICNKYLSIAPILYHKSVGKLCGRCFEKGETKKFPDLTFESQTVYEAVARHLLFPCSFQAKGCIDILDWALVSQHEAACNFRDNRCPFGEDELLLQETKCEWKGNDQNLFDHFMHRHDAHFSEILEISLPASEEPKNTILLSQFMDISVVAILFVTNNKPKNLFFHVLMDIPFAQCELHSYDLEVTDGIDKCKILFAENKVVPLCERSFTTTSLEHGFNMDIAGVEGFLRSKCLNFRFNIKSKQSDSFKEETDLSSSDNNIFDAKCAACGNNLFQYIYFCKDGHNICGDCHRNVEKCKCGKGIENSRNHALEYLSEISLHSCKNRENGCSILTNSKALEFHLRNCELTVKKCVMVTQGCTWSGNNHDLMNHAKELHFVIALNEKYRFDPHKGIKNVCTFLDRKVFVLELKLTHKGNLSIKVQCLGIETSKYRFELAIFSGKQNLTCCHFCAPLLYDDMKKVDEENEPGRIIYPKNMLSQFISDREKTYFKLNIFE